MDVAFGTVNKGGKTIVRLPKSFTEEALEAAVPHGN